MTEEFSVTLKGFKTKEQAKEFLDWYEGQGESDISIWLDENRCGAKYMNIDLDTEYKLDGNNLIAWVEITPFGK